MNHIKKRATSQAPKRHARRGSQLVLMNLLTFLFLNLSSDLEYFYLEAAGLQRIEGVCKRLEGGCKRLDAAEF